MESVSVDSGIRSDYSDIHFRGVFVEVGSRPADDHRYSRRDDDHRYSRRVDGRRYGMEEVGGDCAGCDDNLVLIDEKEKKH